MNGKQKESFLSMKLPKYLEKLIAWEYTKIQVILECKYSYFYFSDLKAYEPY